MVAVDTSTFIAFIEGKDGADVERFSEALSACATVVPAIVFSEILSEPMLPAVHRALVLGLPTLEIDHGYWIRAAATRATILSKKLRARLPDALIAQSCIDHDVALITRDRDFRHFAKYCGLRLA